MNAGKTLFSQLMDCLPWSTFARIVARYQGDHSVQTFPCTEQYRAMAFAQLTYRESLRDIEACLASQPAKLWHMGFGGPVRRSTLADANEVRDWRIYAEFAQRLIAQARRLYVDESLLGDLDSTVYALDSTTIDLCLSLFPWAHFRSTKAAVKMHTLLDLRRNIPSFIHISAGKLHDVHALDMLVPEPGAIYVMDRGYVDFARLHGLHQAGAFFVTRAKSNLNAHRVYSAAPIARPASCRPEDRTGRALHAQRLSGSFKACTLQGPRNRKGARVPYQSDDPAGIERRGHVRLPFRSAKRASIALSSASKWTIRSSIGFLAPGSRRISNGARSTQHPGTS
jgi:Domain of unknown function (DUF4372)/Transposase DDE domain